MEQAVLQGSIQVHGVRPQAGGFRRRPDRISGRCPCHPSDVSHAYSDVVTGHPLLRIILHHAADFYPVCPRRRGTDNMIPDGRLVGAGGGR